MYFIDEEHIVRFKASQHSRQIARLVKYWTGCNLESYPQFIRYDIAQRGLPQPRRTVKQHMVKCLGTESGSLDEDTQVIDYLILTVEITEVQRTQGILKIAFLLGYLLFTYIKIFFHLFQS